MLNSSNDILKVWSSFAPSSVDPYESKYSPNQLITRSVVLNLVSNMKSNEIAPQAAEGWSNSDNMQKWEFAISQSSFFMNGDKLNAEIISKSFKRIILLNKKNNTSDEITKYLEEVDLLDTIEQEISGIGVMGNKIIFNFIKPMPNLLELLTYSLYGIVHPEDYDHDLNWVNIKKIIPSSDYYIKNWSEHGVELEIRNDKAKIKSIKTVLIITGQENAINSSDIAFIDSDSPFIDKATFDFVAKTQKTTVNFVMIQPQGLEFFKNKENRKFARSIFYKELSKKLNLNYEFIPSFLQRKQEENEILELKNNLNQANVDTNIFFYDSKKVESGIVQRGKEYEKATEAMIKSVNGTVRYVPYPDNASDDSKVFHIRFLNTVVDIENVQSSISQLFIGNSFMTLPDENKKIQNLLNEKIININDINNEINDQAYIWPISYIKSGIWVRKNSRINLNDLNLTAFGLDYSLISWE